MMSKVILGSRILLGIIFLVFGSNGLLMFTVGKGFIPMPPPSPEMGSVMMGLMGAKYLMPSVKLVQVISAVLLLSNRLVPLALIMLAPIVYNIVGIHLFVDTAGLPMALGLVVLLGIQFYDKKQKFIDLLK